MTNILENLTKDDLISVIANIHDTIQNWDSGWGFSENEANDLNIIGQACVKHCAHNNSFNMPNITLNHEQRN